jgi:hypothetical protein
MMYDVGYAVRDCKEKMLSADDGVCVVVHITSRLIVIIVLILQSRATGGGRPDLGVGAGLI